MDATKMEGRLRALLRELDSRYLRLDQAVLIYERMLAMEAGGHAPRSVLEIGTFAGTGAILLAAMVEQWDGHVTTVDLPWTGQANQHFEITADERAAEIGVSNLAIVRREDGAEGWMREHLAANRDGLDLVYLDGGHTWANTILQASLSLACLRPGGWLVMDDLHNEAWPDVQEVWETVVRGLVAPWNLSERGMTGFARVPLC